MKRINLKTDKELLLMQQGGKILSKIKNELKRNILSGVSAFEIDKLAEKLILDSGAQSSFKMVPGYKWSTCVNLNSGIVHGIPHKHIVFGDNDVVSVDLGLYYKGFHTDTSFTVYLGNDPETNKFLDAGKEALSAAIKAVKPDSCYVYDVSKAMEDVLRKYDYSPVYDLTGHGIGRSLHEEPYIPCFAEGLRIKSPKIVPGMALAIEAMYTMGSPELIKEKDGWTISTRDGKISGLFEDTIIVTQKGYEVITG